MHVYTPEQWLLLFYFYCLCGWIWESCFVSCKQRRADAAARGDFRVRLD